MKDLYRIMKRNGIKLSNLPRSLSDGYYSKKNIKKAVAQLEKEFPRFNLVVVQMIPKIVKI